MNKYFKELVDAKNDEIASKLGGNLVRLAQLAGGGITSQTEREEIAIALLQKAKELNVDSKNLRFTASELILRAYK